jgi:chaperonin GroEL
MKEVLTGEELRKVMVEAIDLLCDSVGSTLGPSGNNVLINTDDTIPYITNDGVTIAKAIESSDKRINTVLEIAKEASLKTNEEVGDGTTTTLVLLQAIIKEGLKEIEKGKNPIILKQELNEALDLILKDIDTLKKMPTSEDLLNVAVNSSEDKKIGKILTEIYLLMKSRYSCRLTESNSEETYYEIKKDIT